MIAAGTNSMMSANGYMYIQVIVYKSLNSSEHTVCSHRFPWRCSKLAIHMYMTV